MNCGATCGRENVDPMFLDLVGCFAAGGASCVVVRRGKVSCSKMHSSPRHYRAPMHERWLNADTDAAARLLPLPNQAGASLNLKCFNDFLLHQTKCTTLLRRLPPITLLTIFLVFSDKRSKSEWRNVLREVSRLWLGSVQQTNTRKNYFGPQWLTAVNFLSQWKWALMGAHFVVKETHKR